MTSKSQIHCIPGWGFNAKIFNSSKFKKISYKHLNYYRYKKISINAISDNLSKHIQNTSYVLGWSLGGLIAIHLAYYYPEKVKKLILVASQPKLLETNQWPGIPSHALNEIVSNILINNINAQRKFCKLVNYPNTKLSHRRQLEKHLVILQKHTAYSLLKIIRDTDLRDEYKSLNSKILHIIFNQDAIINQDPVKLTTLNTNIQTLTIYKTGHSGFLNQKTTFQQALCDFVYDT
jgi:pimeloyl-[acyl-carrier protein] methyl ester esterase